MFLKKLFSFGKDYNHYLEKGDRYLSDERFAEARNAYHEALQKMEAEGGEVLSRVAAVRRKIALTGNMLGRLNLVEAEHALSSGDGKKAEEHLRIIMELADDPALREDSERLLVRVASLSREENRDAEVPGSFIGGVSGAEREAADHHAVEGAISEEDRLVLYFQTLPGDLPDRYAGMGEDFDRACLLNLDGRGEEALMILEGLAREGENDILDYERAILYFHKGDAERCERLLLGALGTNPLNPLCNIGLVHLYVETGREPEALRALDRMISGDIVPEQAFMMRGDLCLQLGDESNAVESYSRLLSFPRYAREAAGRLVPILEGQGRAKEAAFLTKKYLKGCC